MLNFKSISIAALLTVLSIGASARDFHHNPATPSIDHRQYHQDVRIQRGIASGQLTARETYRLQRMQAEIRRAEARARADGRVTRMERRHLLRLQDRASAAIYHQKHDAQRFWR